MSLYSYNLKELALPSLNNTCSSRETPKCPRLKGIYTVEAVVIIPLLTAFFVALLLFFRIMQTEMIVREELFQVGRLLSAECLSSDDLCLAEAKALLTYDLKDDEIIGKYVEDGALGISLADSVIDDETIRLNASYEIELPFSFFKTKNFEMSQSQESRKWIGERSESEDEEAVYVYVAKNGEVYHCNENCTYLKLSISECGKDDLKNLRNNSGGKYYPCKYCGKKTATIYYYTAKGDRYHSDKDCSELNRTVIRVRLSEVEGTLRPCSRCSQ